MNIRKLGWERVTLPDGKRVWQNGILQFASRAEVEFYEAKPKEAKYAPPKPEDAPKAVTLEVQDSVLGSSSKL